MVLGCGVVNGTLFNMVARQKQAAKDWVIFLTSSNRITYCSTAMSITDELILTLHSIAKVRNDPYVQLGYLFRLF